MQPLQERVAAWEVPPARQSRGAAVRAAPQGAPKYTKGEGAGDTNPAQGLELTAPDPSSRAGKKSTGKSAGVGKSSAEIPD